MKRISAVVAAISLAITGSLGMAAAPASATPQARTIASQETLVEQGSGWQAYVPTERLAEYRDWKDRLAKATEDGTMSPQAVEVFPGSFPWVHVVFGRDNTQLVANRLMSAGEVDKAVLAGALAVVCGGNWICMAILALGSAQVWDTFVTAERRGQCFAMKTGWGSTNLYIDGSAKCHW